jgi:ATP-binding cassette subfamily B protein
LHLNKNGLCIFLFNIMEQKKNSFERLIKLLKLEQSEIVAIYFYAILSGLIQLTLPIGIQTIIGFSMGSTMVSSVYVLVFLVILGVLLVGLFQVNQMRIIEKIQQKIFVRYALEFADVIPKFDSKVLEQYYLPEKINRFFESLNVQKGLFKLLLDIPTASIQILLGLMLLSLYHPFFIIFTIVLILVVWLVFRLTSKKGFETSIVESDCKYSVLAWLEEIGRAVKSLKNSQYTDLNIVKTDEKVLEYINSRTAHFNILLLQFKSLIFFKVGITAIILILGTYLLFEQKLNIGEFVAAEIIILTVINSLEKLIVSIENIYDVMTGLYKLDSVIGNPLESDGTIKLQSNELNIVMENMAFSYDNDIRLFEGVSCKISSGTITCISGNEDSGKSTFLKLLTGSYSDFQGSIRLNDIPIQSYSLESLRGKTGVYFQEQDLFDGSLYENITLGKTAIAIDDIMKMAKNIGIESFILDFPKSFDTLVNPWDKKLKKSTIKKIILLRALVTDPQLLILEDPWYGLEDYKLNIQNYLLKESKSKTIIVSSNEDDFIEKCNHHFLIDGLNVKINK